MTIEELLSLDTDKLVRLAEDETALHEHLGWALNITRPSANRVIEKGITIKKPNKVNALDILAEMQKTYGIKPKT